MTHFVSPFITNEMVSRIEVLIWASMAGYSILRVIDRGTPLVGAKAYIVAITHLSHDNGSLGQSNPFVQILRSVESEGSNTPHHPQQQLH